MRRTTAIALTLRIVIALSTRTFFQPDEYFQSLEPAHRIVFGYGQLTWEWLMPRPIRSVVYPSLNIPIYLFLRVTGLDESWLLVGMRPPQHASSTNSCADLSSKSATWCAWRYHRYLGGQASPRGARREICFPSCEFRTYAWQLKF